MVPGRQPGDTDVARRHRVAGRHRVRVRARWHPAARSDAGWEVVPYKGPDTLDLRSICAFDGALFLADGDALHLLSNGVLAMVDFGPADVVPCAVVVAGSGRLLSVAGLEVWESSDGRRWRSLLPPVR